MHYIGPHLVLHYKHGPEGASGRTVLHYKKAVAGAPPPPPRWSKPRTDRGYIYKQCGKPNCRCMKGGAWHGPYRYQSKREGAQVHSEYVGKRKP